MDFTGFCSHSNLTLLPEPMTLNSSCLLLLGPKGEWEQVLAIMPWGAGGSNNQGSEAQGYGKRGELQGAPSKEKIV